MKQYTFLSFLLFFSFYSEAQKTYEPLKISDDLISIDGVINQERKDYVKNLQEFKIIDGVGEAISILNENSEILNSLKSTYKNSYSKKILSKAKKFKEISIIGMGGSILGTEAIHSFLKHKKKKKNYIL